MSPLFGVVVTLAPVLACEVRVVLVCSVCFLYFASLESSCLPPGFCHDIAGIAV